MVLIIGGLFQGKETYIRDNYRKYHPVRVDECTSDNTIFDRADDYKDGILFVGIEEYIRENLIAGKSPSEIHEEIVNSIKRIEECLGSDIVVPTDEVGNSIVPLDKLERDFRETIGKVQIWLANNSTKVIRMVCGIPNVLKDEKHCNE